MLEVLDPEQNTTFRDHYLDLPFDLSHVFFICTANQLDTVPPALRDRMEVIQLSGYTHEEKREIAKRYLVPRQMERNGVGRSKIEFTDPALDAIIEGYTREAGRARPRARDRVRVPQGRARVRRGQAPLEAHDPPRHRARPCSASRASSRRRPAHRRARRGHGARVDAGGRRRALRGGHLVPRRRQAAGHGPARRRDEGVGRRRALLRQERVRGGAQRRPARGLVPQPRPPRARARGRDRRRTARARASRWPPRSPHGSPAGRCAPTPR